MDDRPPAPSLRIIEKEGAIVPECIELLDRQPEMQFDLDIVGQLKANGNIVPRPREVNDEGGEVGPLIYDLHFANGTWAYTVVGTVDLVNGSTALILREVDDES